MLRRVALVRTDVSEELSSVRQLLVTASVVPSSPILVTLMKEALSSSESSVLARVTWHNIPEDTILQPNILCKNFPFINTVISRGHTHRSHKPHSLRHSRVPVTVADNTVMKFTFHYHENGEHFLFVFALELYNGQGKQTTR
jgi:hypothetical protein